jgi:hypothetical protein
MADGHVDVDEIHKEALDRPTVTPNTTYQVHGEPLAVDRAGHVYMQDDADVIVYRSGGLAGLSASARHAGIGRVAVAPSPDGRSFLVFGDSRVKLYDIAGKLTWEMPVPFATSATWIGDQPVVAGQNGIVKLDRKTGAFGTRACGWSFGLSAADLDPVPEMDSVCDAE